MKIDREMLARIIAPEVWARHNRFGQFTAYTAGMAPSLEKADAILALLDEAATQSELETGK